MKNLLSRITTYLLCSLPAVAQFQPTSFTRGPENITLQWQGGSGPYLVESSGDLSFWSDQGEPAAGLSRTLPALNAGNFYRIRDFNPANTFGSFFGLIQTDQGEFGSLLARHRLKSRLWLYKTKEAPHTSASSMPSVYFRKLILLYQYHDAGLVRTWSGPLETLGTIATPTSQRMTVTWTRGSGPALQTWLLTLNFPYAVNTLRTAPLPSDPEYELRCTRATPQPEFDGSIPSLTHTTVDTTRLYQLNPGNPALSFPQPRKYRVTKRNAFLDVHHHDGLPLIQGAPPFIWKTFILDRWLSPSTGGGGTLPAFSTDSYFSRTLLPGHHNFVEIVLFEPALDPALPALTRATLLQQNIRYIYTLKDLDIGSSPDDIRYFGFDNTVRDP